jgi:hypothetical protein
MTPLTLPHEWMSMGIPGTGAPIFQTILPIRQG